MPRRSHRIQAHAKAAEFEGGQWFFAFVNTGRANYHGFEFDAERWRAHRLVRQAIVETLRELVVVSTTGGPAPAVNLDAVFARCEGAVQPRQQRVRLMSDVAQNLDWLRRMRREVMLRRGSDTAIARYLQRTDFVDQQRIRSLTLYARSRNFIDRFLLSPTFEGFRLLAVCRQCNGWFLQSNRQQAYCSLACRSASKSEQTRARVRRFRVKNPSCNARITPKGKTAG